MAVVEYEKKGKIATITINRPGAMNAMNREVYRLLEQVMEDVERDDGVWVAIVTGAGDRAFSAGADLKEYAREPFAEFFQRSFPRWYHSMFSIKPFIAAINGYCLAGGLELAMACDIRIASENAQLGSPEVRWGVLHGWGATTLPKSVPMSSALEMLLSGEFINAQEAYRLGMVSRVVPPDKLISTAESLADRICENAPLAVRVTKELAYRGWNLSPGDAERLVHSMAANLASTEDAREGPKAFAEKRKPIFKAK